MSPAIQGDYISDLDLLASITLLVGGLFEVEVLAGPVPGAYVSRKLTTEQLVEYLSGEVGSNLATVDLLELTTDQMNEVMALAFTDCDADPAASPAWSFPGQWFDAKVNGENRHYYCGRGTYDPTAPAGTTGQGPAWHYFIKLG